MIFLRVNLHSCLVGGKWKGEIERKWEKIMLQSRILGKEILKMKEPEMRPLTLRLTSRGILVLVSNHQTLNVIHLESKAIPGRWDVRVYFSDWSFVLMHFLSKSFFEKRLLKSLSLFHPPSSSFISRWESHTFLCLHSCLRWCFSFLLLQETHSCNFFSTFLPKNKGRRCCVKEADFWSLSSCIFSHRIRVEGPDNVPKSISAFNSLCLLFNEWPKDRLMVFAPEYITYIEETCRLPLSSSLSLFTSSGCCSSSFIALFPLNAKKATLSEEA